MMWRRGRKSDNISNLLRFKVIIPVAAQFTFNRDDPYAKHGKVDGNKASFLLGDDEENYNSYNKIQNYSSFQLHRMSTRIQNFKVHRLVETEFKVNDEDHWTDDKLSFTDPIVYFYREKFGRGLPGAFGSTATKNAFLEVCKHKCIRSCKDGWFWSTKFPTKGERKMVDTSVLTKLVNRTTPIGNLTKDQLLAKLGVVSKQEDDGIEDIHNCMIAVGRGIPYPNNWYTLKKSAKVSDVLRYVTDYLSFDMITYITVRCYRHKL